jgi:predicted transcriptional regulator
LRVDALRSQKMTVNLTPEMAARLDRLARRHHWKPATAAAVLIERGLDADERERGLPSVREQAHGSAA